MAAGAIRFHELLPVVEGESHRALLRERRRMPREKQASREILNMERLPASLGRAATGLPFYHFDTIFDTMLRAQ